MVFLRVNAQEKRISGDFSGVAFPAWVKQIETVTGYHFYYDPADVDSVLVNLSVKDAPLAQVLDRVFAGTELHYAIDPTQRVFITKQYSIRTDLPPRSRAAGHGQGEKGRTEAGKAGHAGQAGQAEEEDLSEKGSWRIQAENKLVEIGDRAQANSRGKATIAGYVRDAKTGEPIVGASLTIDTLRASVVTDQFGYYSLTLNRGRHILRVSSAGMKDIRRQVQVYSDGKFSADMDEAVTTLKTVVVSAEKTSNTKSVQMGVNRLTINTIKQVPVVFGEADVLKVVLTLPGVTTVGEASNGFNVRGGSTDQNLILFDDATIYNPSHLFGFFSAFDPDVVKGIELFKSAIPEKYGGRLSSVLNVSMLDGNNKKWTGLAGIGPLTSKFVIQGPLSKEKTSMIAGVRFTYSDWLLRSIGNNAYSNSTAGFYDANLRITHTINAKNTLYLMGYISGDRFNLNNDTTYKYSNQNANIKWKHTFNTRASALISAGYDRYQYNISSAHVPANAFRQGFDINQSYFKADFTYNAGDKHVISYGLNSIYYKLHPGSFAPQGDVSLVSKTDVPAEQGIENALYLGDQFTVSPKISVNAGIRYSLFTYLGPHDEYNYLTGQPRELSTIVDTTMYGKGQAIKTYMAPEVRISSRFVLSEKSSVKFSFNTLQQYIHMLSNTVAVSPTDIWKLSDPHIKPQQGYQVSLGYYRNFRANTIEASVEVYYKQMRNYLDYKSGADLVMNPHIETDVISTKGEAYGAELLIKKSVGRMNGWFSYTWSRTFLKQDDPLAGELINQGKYYPASFDKPNNLNLIWNYRFSHRYSVSMNVVYSTGRPITLPLAVFTLGGTTGVYYSERNQYRIPDYFRTDISVNIEGNHRVRKLSHNYWSAGIYNLTGRENPYSIYFVQEGSQIKGYQLSIFGTPIPFVTYTIKF
jgi:hypothetical protein